MVCEIFRGEKKKKNQKSILGCLFAEATNRAVKREKNVITLDQLSLLNVEEEEVAAPCQVR